jgi:hypothetical protein
MKPMTCKDAFSLMDEQGFVLNPDRPYTNKRFHELVILCDRVHKVILEAESIFEQLKNEMAEIAREES